MLKEARDAPPPQTDAGADAVEVFWATVLAELRGGPWEDRLAELYSKSRRAALDHGCRLLQLTDIHSSRLVWRMMRSAGGHPDLERLWEILNYDRLQEYGRSPPDPDPDAPPDDPFGTRPPEDYAEPDWSYLNERDVPTMVRRLDLYLSGWHPVAEALKPWLIEAGVETTGRALAALQSGSWTIRRFGLTVTQQIGAAEQDVLAAWLERGPDQELAPAVVRWIQLRILKESAPLKADRLWRDILRDPRWVERFPELEVVLRELLR